MNEMILNLIGKLKQMKKVEETGFTDPEMAKGYFKDKEIMMDEIAKALKDYADSNDSEIKALKSTIAGMKDFVKSKENSARELTRNEFNHQLGKTIAALWTGNRKTLEELQCTRNLKTENWSNAVGTNWNSKESTEKTLIGDPMGNMATNDQYLINPVYENQILQDARKVSVMMPLVTNRPMNSSSIFIPTRDRGGVILNWLTSYGQKIDSSKPDMGKRLELKAYTLAGFIPWFDEFEEDVFAELGQIFTEEFIDAYAKEFDKQCLIAKASPFTGALESDGVTKFVLKSASPYALTYKDLRDAVLKVPAEERKDCSWFFNETVLAQITKLEDDSGRPIWRGPADSKPGNVDGYSYYESTTLPAMESIQKESAFAIFMNPKRIIHGSRKGIELKRFDATSESLEYGEIFLRFRKRDGFLTTRSKGNMVALCTGA